MKAFVLVLVASLALLSHPPTATAATTNIYFTAFEAAEGYSTNLTLIGQGGWSGSGSGDNGVVNQYILGQGQQALIGGYSTLPATQNTALWHFIDFFPVTSGYPIVNFSVLLNIADSLNTQWDTFSWDFYNIQGDRLFSLDFDNYTNYLDVSFQLDGTNQSVLTPVRYVNNSNYTLNVTMNFASNRWSATLNHSLITTNQFITTTNAPLNLGDIDPVWLVFNTNAPGDNYMLFDNYRVTAETLPVTPAQVQFLGRTGEGWGLLRVLGGNNTRWSLDATTNFVNWTAVKTNVISGSYVDVVDTGAAGHSRRFYRARHVP